MHCLGYGPGATSQYGQVPQGPVPYAGPGPGPGGPSQLGYSSYGQQVAGPRMAGQQSTYSMYSGQPHVGDSRMYPMQHAAEQYSSAMHQNAASMSGWQGKIRSSTQVAQPCSKCQNLSTGYPSMNPPAQYSAMGHGSYRPLHPQHAQQQQQQQHAQPHYPHQPPMRHSSQQQQQQQQQPYGAINGPSAAATAAATAKNIPPNYGTAPAASMHPQYPHSQGTPVAMGVGGAYGSAPPIRSAIYSAENSMATSHQQHQQHQQQQQQLHQQQQQQQQQPQPQQPQGGPKPYPYSMQAPYPMSAQHFMPESTAQPHTTQQPQQEVPSVYQQQQQQSAPTQLHSTPHYRYVRHYFCSLNLY